MGDDGTSFISGTSGVAGGSVPENINTVKTTSN